MWVRIGIVGFSALFSLNLLAAEKMTRQSPFVATHSLQSLALPGQGPEQNRQKEILEGFDLSSLTYVGLIRQGPKKWGLVQDDKGLVHTVHVGSYMGKQDGKVVAILPEKVLVEQWVPQSRGQFQKDEVSLELK